MSISQLAGASYLNPVRLARAQNGAGAEGQLPSDIAAYNRWLAEYASGAVQQEQAQVAPPTPIFGYTTPGHDHSGGLMGKPQKHTVWIAHFGSLSSSYADFEDAPQTTVTGAGDVRTLADSEPRGVWIPGGRVYESLSFAVRLYCSTEISDYSVSIRPSNGQTYSTSGTLALGANDITIASVSFSPGRLHKFHYSIRLSYNAAAPSVVHLIFAALHQTSDTP